MPCPISKALRYGPCVTRGSHSFTCHPHTNHICLNSPAARHHHPLAGTHYTYPRRDGQAELTCVCTGTTHVEFSIANVSISKKTARKKLYWPDHEVQAQHSRRRDDQLHSKCNWQGVSPLSDSLWRVYECCCQPCGRLHCGRWRPDLTLTAVLCLSTYLHTCDMTTSHMSSSWQRMSTHSQLCYHTHIAHDG